MGDGQDQDWGICRPTTWWSDQTESLEEEVEPYPTIPDMCPAVRALILNSLDRSELKMVRQVCRSLQTYTDDVVGVSAEFQPLEPVIEPEPGLIDRTLNFFSSNATEAPLTPDQLNEARVQEMLAWLGKVTVMSLKVRRLSAFPFQPASLKHPLRLRRLVLDFDEDILPLENGHRVTEMLQLFDNLTVLNVTICPRFSTQDEDEDEDNDNVYRASVSSLLEAVRLGLQFKPTLKDVSVVLEPPAMWMWTNWPELVERPQDQPLGPDFPKGLRNLELHLPSRLYPQKATNWKSLLDGQEQLERLKLDLGNLYWRRTSMALRKNSASLRHLDLRLSTAVNDEQLRAEPIPQDQWLDWNELATTQNLESLSIHREHGRHRLQSLNFLTFQLPHLQRLELKCVFLTQAEFEKIFFGLPSLNQVRLQFWSAFEEYFESTEVQVESIDRAHRTCDVLARALPLNRFQSITLRDYMRVQYPKFLRDRIPDLPNYSVTWPEEYGLSLVINRI